MNLLVKKATDAAQGVFLWVDDRLHVTKLWESTAGHHVPKSAGSWFYVFGSATLLCFMIQVMTGIMLALVYVPSGAEAYATLEYLTFQQNLGWLLRGIHYWGSNFMVGIMVLHMTQVYLFGAYKYPREITWLSGLVLMVLTLGLAFTGQVMRFDEDAYWGLGIGAAIVGRVPFIGQELLNLMLGGQIIASETLSRFFALHVFVLPGAVLAVVSLHLRMVLTKGINEYPQPGMLVRRETYDKEYAAILKKEGVPFFPKAISKDLVAAAVVILGILTCALVFGPKGPLGPADPVQIDTAPRPDFWFLWIFAVAALLPPEIETVALLVGPVVIGVILVALPFVNGTGEKSWRRRPFAVIIVLLTYVALGMLTYLGHTSPWSPDMIAWKSAVTPTAQIVNRTPLELQGAVVLQKMQCRNCHAIDGIGGERGPDLTDVGTRLTTPQLIRQVVQGGGNMPAFGQNLTPSQIDAVVAYMATLRPEGVPAARDSSQPAVPPTM
jgi:ubiquinol-cytochrome c reductase cytochrome b subunit